MKIHKNAALIEHLASSYALGTLRGGARRRFETLAVKHVSLRVAVNDWQTRLGAMNELSPAAEPSPNVWKRIQNLIAAERLAPTAAQKLGELDGVLARLRQALGWWRGGALAGALASVTAVVVGLNLNGQVEQTSGLLSQAVKKNGELLAQLQAAPRIEYVAVLSDDKSAASMLVTFDPQKQALTLKRVGDFKEAQDRSLQLWALPPAGGPQSLGVLGQDRVIRLSAPGNAVQNVPTLAISLEPKGGVPSAGGPTGPVLFKGALLQTAL